MILFVILVFVTFLAMELFSYVVHRFLYHGWAWCIHKSHHSPRKGVFEWNDIFPTTFAALTIALATYAVADPIGLELLAVAVGTTAYGIMYFVIHDLYIHRRVKHFSLRIGFLRKVKQAHALHHRYGGEPYGLLFFLDPQRAATENVDETKAV